MKIAFFGTPDFAAKIFEELIQNPDCDVVAYKSAKDKVRGRGNKLVPSPVKEIAIKYNIANELPEDIDFICVVAYGSILKKEILSLPKYECLNVHGSLLPRWRGAAPIERAILEGDKYSGVSIMRMEEGLDTGAYCMQESFEIGNMNSLDIYNKIAEISANCLIKSMNNIMENNVEWTKQDESKVTYAHKIEKHELNIDSSCISSLRKIKASSKAHPSKVKIADKSVTILDAKLADTKIKEGMVLFENKKLYLGFTDGALEILKVKPDGKREMEAKAFALGIKSGEIFWQN